MKILRALTLPILASLLAFLVLGTTVAALPAAPTGGGERDEWEQTDPTSWAWWHSKTSTEVTNLLTANNLRIVDLEVQQESPLLYAFATVQNSGFYAKASAWFPSLTVSEVTALLNENEMRLIDLEAHNVGGLIRYSVVMVSDTGVDDKVWWWYPDASPAQIDNLLVTNNARLIDIDSYVTGGVRRYAAIMILRTGNDNVSSWWYPNLTPAEVATRLDQNGARLIDMQQETTGRYVVIMQAHQNIAQWYYYGASEADAGALASQNGTRIIDLDPYLESGQWRFNIVLINNEDPISTRVGHILRAGIVNGSGTYGDASAGLYLKRTDGNNAQLAGLHEDSVFEPASTIKVTAHLYAMQQVQAENVTLNSQIPRYFYGQGSCPGSSPSGTESLETALSEMMWNSDNARTKSVITYFGRTNINNNSHNIGMDSTNINHTIGCAAEALATPNELTLRDAGRLYEGVADLVLLNTQNRATFYELMAGKDVDFTGIWSNTETIIEEEAPPGMPQFQIDAYKEQVELSYKAGGYGLCPSGGACQYYLSVAGRAELPECVGNILGSSEYVFGVFLDKAPNQSQAGNAFNGAKAELFREQISDRMSNWGNCFITLNTPTRTAVVPTSTRTATPRPPTQTPGGPSATPEPSGTPEPTPCSLQFTDVPEGSTFYSFVRCLACRQILGGYSDGTFRPGADITRGQIAKIVANAAGYVDDVTGRQTYSDVSPTQTFWLWIERLSLRGVMGGYACGGAGEPCDAQNRPYFRPQNNATRGQLSKIVSNAAGYTEPVIGPLFEDVPSSNTFYAEIIRLARRGIISGYGCGGPGEPCVAPDNLPYFRPSANVTRGQASKIVANTFYLGCQTP